MSIDRLSQATFPREVEALIRDYPELRKIVGDYGIPDFWSRPEGFETLVRIILEQQVSLLSAKAAWDRVVAGLGSVTVERVAGAGEEKLRVCGVTRQKARYIVALAQDCRSGQLKLEALPGVSDVKARERLCSVTGIGRWTANVYLLSAMGRIDIWPSGDIALIRTIETLCPEAAVEDFDEGLRWQGKRSIAARLFWHHYLSQPGREKVMQVL